MSAEELLKGKNLMWLIAYMLSHKVNKEQYGFLEFLMKSEDLLSKGAMNISAELDALDWAVTYAIGLIYDERHKESAEVMTTAEEIAEVVERLIPMEEVKDAIQRVTGIPNLKE